MRAIETDYLVVGAGATGLAFIDTLIAHSDAEVLVVDRLPAPGGHWVGGYPFLRLHQASANYGTDSRPLGENRIDESGFYERATGAEMREYFARVLHDDLLPTGRVRFLGLADYRGEDAEGHHVVSLQDGADTTVKVRKRLVDATYIQSDIPVWHTPGFSWGEGVRVVTPNTLPEVVGAAGAGYTVLGAGKTSMDTITWLLEQGVDPDRIRWIKPGESWMFDRAAVQPLQLVGSYMRTQAHWVEAAAQAEDGADFARRLEAAGVFVRIDPNVEGNVFRGATLSMEEVLRLRTVQRVVRKGRVVGIDGGRVTLAHGEEPAPPNEIYVDCTAAGVRPVPVRPIFEPGRMSMQFVTVGGAGWSAATLGFIEASERTDEEKNRLCPVISFSGRTDDILRLVHAGMRGLRARIRDADVAVWNEGTRLNPGAGAMSRMDEADIADAFATMATQAGAAMANLKARTAEVSAAT